jgi:hypothetical protein
MLHSKLKERITVRDGFFLRKSKNIKPETYRIIHKVSTLYDRLLSKME